MKRKRKTSKWRPRKKRKKSTKKNWLVYLIQNTDNKKTYIGATNNIRNRVKAHNGWAPGGALFTKINKGKGSWRRLLTGKHLTKSRALSLEYRSKHSKVKPVKLKKWDNELPEIKNEDFVARRKRILMDRRKRILIELFNKEEGCTIVHYSS